MQMKKRLMAVLALLIIVMMIPACAGAVVDYTVDKPAGYTTSMKYPVIYVMPEDGYARDNSGLTTKLLAAMNNGDGAKMLIVRPTFTAGMDLFAEMAALVQDVDANYSTIPDAAHRAIAGVGTGGYLAYALAVTDSTGALRNAPDLFAYVGSIDGNFVSNPWHSTYADIYAKASALTGNSFNNVFNKFYTYMDTPVESQFADDVNGTNDLGELFINRGTASDVHEYTARLGARTDAFLAESASRMLDRFSGKMVNGLVSGSASLVNATLPQSASTATVEYELKVGSGLSTYATGSVEMKVIAKVVDPATGDVLATGTKTHTVTAGGTYTGTINVGNKVNDLVSNVVIAAELLNDQSDVTTTYLIRYKAPTSDHVELMGDWYFNYTGTGTKLDCTTLTPAEFETWSTALPALMNWGDGYGNISDPGWYGDWFSFMITGSGYYAKKFTVPADFDVTAPKLSIGYVDDRCEVFLNGVCVGRTGMNASGNPTGETTWAVYSCFDVDPSLINVGGENVVIVRAWNDTPYGAGGWYAGPVGLYSADGFAAAGGGGGDTARFYEETFHSDALGADNEYLIYLPKDYNKSEYYYPTLYLLHQFNSDHTSYRADKIDQLMDEAIESGLFDEMIVVIPNSDENSWWKGKWENMVTQDLIPHIEKNYRAIPDARYRMTAGCSMGGQGAFSVALCNPQMFTGSAAFFGAFDYGNGMGRINPVTLAGNEGAEYMDYFSMAFICGNQDDYKFGQGKIQLHQVLKNQGVEHYFFIENGKHDSKFYVPYFKDTIAYVRGNMPRDNALSAPKYTVSCDVLEENTLRITITADESIKDSFLQIPDSSYSSGYEPSITVPFVVRFDADESSKAAYEYRFNATFTEDSLTWEENIDLSEYGANARVRSIKTQFLGRDTRNGNAKLDTLGFDGNNALPQLPSTGDESNIFFAAAVLMTSVAALFVLRRRNA